LLDPTVLMRPEQDCSGKAAIIHVADPHQASVGSHSIGEIDQSVGARTSVELRQIDCFLAVATDLHFGKAAKRLSLSQSSVSEAIRLLENEVGGQLFVRRAGVSS
jgi:hypothetical protein